jgi:hypothetical protein
LYTDFESWRESIERGRQLIRKRMTYAIMEKILGTAFSEGDFKLKENRQANYFQAVAWSEAMKASEMRLKYQNQRLRK